ncbi:MAG TPA: MmcQ/YjbR family DNA-binding protein [Rhizomicrobium sp.]|nr:MmcQ/YjbR family DNA-binding protein [Rhizomicrobium sp.]
MPTAADIRKIALALEGTREVDHFARPAFRTPKRIYAVIRPDGLWLNLPVERKEFLLEADPAAFVKYMWGKTVNVIVQPERVSAAELKVLLREAWEFSAAPPPKKKKKPAPRK